MTYYFDQDDIRNAVVYTVAHGDIAPTYRVEITIAPNLNIHEDFFEHEDAITRAEWWMQLVYQTKWANIRKLQEPIHELGE